MKTILIICLCFTCLSGFGQRQIELTKGAAGIEKISFDFKYPELITLSAWDNDEIEITGQVKINNGENDEAFKIEIEEADNQIYVKSTIEDLENLPKRILIRREGVDYYFPTNEMNDPTIQKFLNEGDGEHQYQMHGVIKEITLSIKVPKNKQIEIHAKYGLVEISNLDSPLMVNAKYGGVDVSLHPDKARNITAKTKFGELYSDLDMVIDANASKHSQYYNWTSISAQLAGGGTPCTLESKHGNVYIRRQ